MLTGICSECTKISDSLWFRQELLTSLHSCFLFQLRASQSIQSLLHMWDNKKWQAVNLWNVSKWTRVVKVSVWEVWCTAEGGKGYFYYFGKWHRSCGMPVLIKGDGSVTFFLYNLYILWKCEIPLIEFYKFWTKYLKFQFLSTYTRG